MYDSFRRVDLERRTAALLAAFATPQATFEAVACDPAYAVRRANLHGSFWPDRRMSASETRCAYSRHLRGVGWSSNFCRSSSDCGRPLRSKAAIGHAKMNVHLPGRRIDHGTRFASLITWTWVNSYKPSCANSTPSPDCLAPPNGMVGPKSRCLLIHTVPASMRVARSCAF